MDSFLNLASEILPLYAISILGFIAGKGLKIDAKSITTLTIYMLSPVVFFLSLAQVNFTSSALIAPAVTFMVAAILAPLILRVTKCYLGEKTPYLSALATGTNNWGYFGLPIAFSLFNPEQVAAYIVIGFGFQMFENTLGIYYASRGHKSPLESFFAVFKFPAIYAITGGLAFSYLGLDIPSAGEKLFDLFKGAYTVLGMMIIGLGVASLDKFRIDIGFSLTMCIMRFVMWPALATGIIFIDSHLGLLGSEFYKPLMLFSMMPMAANNIAFATQFNMHPGKASVAVLITTILALVYIPFALQFFGI
ncbi:MAG: putative permease [Alphaproteobacteria bacterium]|jgi:predicted permease